MSQLLIMQSHWILPQGNYMGVAVPLSTKARILDCSVDDRLCYSRSNSLPDEPSHSHKYTETPKLFWPVAQPIGTPVLIAIFLLLLLQKTLVHVFSLHSSSRPGERFLSLRVVLLLCLLFVCSAFYAGQSRPKIKFCD